MEADARDGESEPPTRQERARLLAADQALQSLLVNYGLVEDWEARILEELAQPDEPSGEASGLGHSMTLRRMRQTGALGELDQTVQSTLLGSTLYRYSRDVPPVRAAAARPPAPAPEANLNASGGLGGTQAMHNLRRVIERMLQGSPDGGASSDELNSSLGSTMLGMPGVAGPELGSTVGMLEGHLSPLGETNASFGGHLSPLAETVVSLGPSSAGGPLRRDPAGETTDSWSMGGSGALDRTATVMGASMARLEDGDRTGMLLRLLSAAELDESLARSVRRVLQIGSALTGDGLSQDEIEDLPKVHFDKKEEQQCSICLEAFDTGELLTQLPCSHFFHVDCVSRWFKQSTQCPLCRGQVGSSP